MLGAVAALSLFAGRASHGQGTPTIDLTAIATLKQQVSTLSQQLTAVTSVVQQTQTMVNQIGYPIATLINLPNQLTSFKNFSWYSPSAMSPILSSVPGLDWSNPTNARNSTQTLFYAQPSGSSSGSSGGSTSLDTQSTLAARRQAAVRDAATNAWTIAQQYRNMLTTMQDDITRLSTEANGATVSQVEQANADIGLTALKYQVAQGNLIAALTQLQAAEAIAADPSYSVSGSATTGSGAGTN
jgi:hypothetical protein